jgi:hypothetical protein
MFLRKISTVTFSSIALPFLIFAQTPYRAVVKTITLVETQNTKRVIESLSTIAVKGEKYRLSMLKPEPMIYICDGTVTKTINPITKGTRELPSGGSAGQGINSGLLSRIAESKQAEVTIDPSWDLPKEIKKLKITYSQDYPDKIDFFTESGDLFGTFLVDSTETVNNLTIPVGTTFSSAYHGINMSVVTCYSGLEPDDKMPDELFTADFGE